MPCRNKSIRINPPTDLRIVITADGGVVVTGLQVVEPGFVIEVVATVAEGVDVRKCVRGCIGNIVTITVFHAQNIAPGVVGVAGYQGAVALVDPEHVALQVLDEVVVGPALADAVIPQGNTGDAAAFVVVIAHPQGDISAAVVPGLAQVSTLGNVVRGAAAGIPLFRAQTGCVVAVAGGFTAVGGACQTPSFRPGEGIAVAIVIAQRIAVAVVGDGLPVNRRQQVLPLAVSIGVGMGLGTIVKACDIAVGIVAVAGDQGVGAALVDP